MSCIWRRLAVGITFNDAFGGGASCAPRTLKPPAPLAASGCAIPAHLTTQPNTMKTKTDTTPAAALASNSPLGQAQEPAPPQGGEQEPATAPATAPTPAPEKAAAATLWQWAHAEAVPVRADILSAWGEYAHRGQISARDRRGIIDSKSLRDLVAAAGKRDDKRTIELVRKWGALQAIKESVEKAGLVNSKGEII